MKPITWIAAALMFACMPGNVALATAPEEAFLVVDGADEVANFKLSPSADQVNYIVKRAYPERVVGEPQEQKLVAAGWHKCRTAQTDWVKTVDAATPDRTIHLHETLWSKEGQLIIIKLRYFSAANAATPDNDKQRVNLVFYSKGAREMANWLKADCSQ